MGIRRPWEDPHEHLEEMEHAELRMLRWLINAQVAIGTLLVAHSIQQEDVMAALDVIKEIMASDRAATEAEHAEVDAAIEALLGKVTDLQAKVDELTAGAVPQADLDEIAAGLKDLGTAIGDIYTQPVAEPPVEEPPVL
jgi:hypothetical protein